MSASSEERRALARRQRLADIDRRLTAARARRDTRAEARLIRVRDLLMKGLHR